MFSVPFQTSSVFMAVLYILFLAFREAADEVGDEMVALSSSSGRSSRASKRR